MKTTFPEDLTVLSTEALETLRVAGLEEFDLLYPKDDQFASVSAEDLTTLSTLRDGLKGVTDELSARADRAEKLAGMGADRAAFAKVSGTFEGETDEEVAPETEAEMEITANADRDAAPEFSAAAATEPETPPIVAYAAGQGLGVPLDAPLDWDGVGRALDHQLNTFNVTPYKNAAQRGTPLKTTQSFARFTKAIPEDQRIRSGASQADVRSAIERARNQGRLKGKSLIAAGGWGAPSQISYDRFPKLSSRDGIATFPEISVEHGGLQIPHGSTFAEVYANADFIAFNEEQDIDGEYALSSGGNVEGTKPVYRIPPTVWEDYRLQVDGVHIQAGILENRGYPQGVAAEVAQVLDVHAHVINAKILARAAALSTAITFTGTPAGATAPILAAVELQVLHYRDTHRMEFDEALEAKFPNWLKGALRADLSRRLGVDLLDVTDARMEGWFRDRGVVVEWVYDWQSIAGTPATGFLAPPTSVSFLLYAAGTFIKGTSDVISLDTMYDSTLLGTNDFTVMFSEEGWFLAKQGPDSRVITVPISADGATHIGVEISNAGTV